MKVTEEEIIEALTASMGRQNIAANALGVTPSAINQRIKDSDTIKAALKVIEEDVGQTVEYNMITAAVAGEYKASKYYLGCKRGWSEKQTVEVEPKGGRLAVDVNRELTFEEAAQIVKDRGIPLPEKWLEDLYNQGAKNDDEKPDT